MKECDGDGQCGFIEVDGVASCPYIVATVPQITSLSIFSSSVLPL